MSAGNQITISGAREHNLKDLSLSLPRDPLVVITGLSGSGKSSLAFDTIYAEGQRRYVESLSAYARQFLGQMDKPDVDSIEGLSPAISIDQKTTSRNPRSTVGTVTEIYDYLRLLWARVGKPHCHICGRPIVGQSAEQIVDQVMELPEGTRFMVLAPVVRGRKGEYGKLLEELRADGFARVRIDGRVRMLEESIVLDKRYKHDISVRGRPARDAPRPAQAPRRFDRDGGRSWPKDWSRSRSSPAPVPSPSGTSRPAGAPRGPARPRGDPADRPRRRAASRDAVDLLRALRVPRARSVAGELEPRIFSFNSPHGACEHCTGLGSQLEIDPDLLVPTIRYRSPMGRSWRGSGARQLLRTGGLAIAERYGVDLDAPWKELTQDEQDLFLYGTGRASADPLPQPLWPQPLLRDALPGDRREPRAPLPRDRLRAGQGADRGVHVAATLPGLRRRRLRPESRAVLVAGTNIAGFHRAVGPQGPRVPRRNSSSPRPMQHVARLILRRSPSGCASSRTSDSATCRWTGPRRRCPAARLSGSAWRRRSARYLVGVLYMLDEPSIGLHQRDNATADRDPRAAARSRQHRASWSSTTSRRFARPTHCSTSARAPGEHGGEVVAAGHARRVAARTRVAHGPVPVGQRSRSPFPRSARKASG